MMTKIVNLSRDFRPFGGPTFNSDFFPSGLEENFYLEWEEFFEHLAPAFGQHRQDILITYQPKQGDNVLCLAFALDAIKSLMAKYLCHVRFHLYMPYLRYARQDRLNKPGEAFTLKIFCNYINSLNFNTVFILDCHSYVGEALLNNCVNINNHKFVKDCVNLEHDKVMLVCPDDGARKKVDLLAKELKYTGEIIQGEKKRNAQTGKIEGMEIKPIRTDISDKVLVIVDDICSYGGTFIRLATALREQYTFKDLILVVTHYEGVANEEDLGKLFKYIFTTDSIGSPISNTNLIKRLPIPLNWMTIH